ncbi:hypothetical protein ONS95_003432 [Cadophora gregata]|uniref:uncharacterized protein n=1 Tax=Cadophora gregata TaxID=51156 RepID=UPI0026DA9193|nr:uncharacterized protein ONS95_003432 [Cadophora gregata]KAK0108639.1 hypothetical protein ONS95_003432 [Cadophora gregata]KAK0108770.1 hypothetical protein ONS96_002615 [Cadophora gregata f. sp. sojae]
MSTSTPTAADKQQAIIAAAALCDNFDSLISDYGILTGAFPLEDPHIKDCFISRDIITSMELVELDDKARKLRSRVEKDARKEKYRYTPRERHENARKYLEKRFKVVVEDLKELKIHLESSFPFKYLPNCSYRLLGEVGKQPAQEIRVPQDLQQYFLRDSTLDRIFPALNGLVQSPIPHASPREEPVEQFASDPSPFQSPQTIKRTFPRFENTSQPSDRNEFMMSSKYLVKQASKSTRPRRLVAMGIAERIANTISNPQEFNHPFGILAPEVQTPQQIWRHRFPNGYSQLESAEYTRALEELLAASTRKRKLLETAMSKRLKAAQAKNSALEATLKETKKENKELKENNGQLGEKLERQRRTISRQQTSGHHRISFTDVNLKTKRKRHYDELGQEVVSKENKDPDLDLSTKRLRIS